MTALAVIFAGVALVVAGLVVLFGAWAAVVCGALLIAAGVAVDWEVLRYGKHPAPPSR